jgi:periplasmic divalent cation tolerance protein
MGEIVGEIVLALTTLPPDLDAHAFAVELVGLNLAACVTIVPGVTSVYRWQGAIDRSSEQQLLIKTHRDRVAPLWAALKARHPYDVPEFVVIPVIDGNPDYLKWIEESVRPSSASTTCLRTTR